MKPTKPQWVWYVAYGNKPVRYVIHVLVLGIVIIGLLLTGHTAVATTYELKNVLAEAKPPSEDVVFLGGGPVFFDQDTVFPQVVYHTYKPEPVIPVVIAEVIPTPQPVEVVQARSNIGACTTVVTATVGTGTFIWPVTSHDLSGYSYSRWHLGLDLAAQYGESVHASDSGLVIWAGWNNWGYGNLVVLDHGNGWQTYYAHNSEIYVSCGQSVKQGDVISAVGSSGHSTGPHLHFETRFNNTIPNPFEVLPNN